MITYLRYIGVTDSGHFTNNNLYLVLSFSLTSGNPSAIVLNDSSLPESAIVNNWPDTWEIASVSVLDLKQVYPL